MALIVLHHPSVRDWYYVYIIQTSMHCRATMFSLHNVLTQRAHYVSSLRNMDAFATREHIVYSTYILFYSGSILCRGFAGS